MNELLILNYLDNAVHVFGIIPWRYGLQVSRLLPYTTLQHNVFQDALLAYDEQPGLYI